MFAYKSTITHTGNRSSFISFAFSITILLAFIMAGCGESSTAPPNGNGGGNGNGNGGGEIGTSPTFDNISQIFAASCVSCHGAGGESGVRLNTYTNVIESVGDQYGALVVNPGNPGNSPLVEKIESSNPTHGVRMPQGGPYLSNERIEQIKAWIDNGAEDDQSSDGSSGGNNGNGNGGGY